MQFDFINNLLLELIGFDNPFAYLFQGVNALGLLMPDQFNLTESSLAKELYDLELLERQSEAIELGERHSWLFEVSTRRWA